MAFEDFTKPGRSFKPLLTLRRSGHIGLNNGALHRFALDRYTRVRLRYDRDTRRIGVQPLKNSDDSNTFKLRIKEGNVTISGRSFLEHYDIPYAQGGKYEAVWDDEGMVVADLRKPIR